VIHKGFVGVVVIVVSCPAEGRERAAGAVDTIAA
jgi:hypothetical protein